MNTEYVRNLHSNYLRLQLEQKPEEKKYQYCILSRGGIKGLLPCSLRYMDGSAYLYYDITSKQNLAQFYQKGNISREWILDFVLSIQNLQRELGRFLLQEDNVIWEPQHVFQDLENNVFSFLYMPYYTGENQFIRLLGFLVEKIDYEDETLVECVYKMYEQFEKNGMIYLQEQIFKDVKILEKMEKKENKLIAKTVAVEKQQETVLPSRSIEKEPTWERYDAAAEEKGESEEMSGGAFQAGKDMVQPKKIFGFFESKRGRKQKEQERREEYQESLQKSLDGFAVAESLDYEEGYGRTVFLTEKPEKKEVIHRLYFADGRKASELDTTNLLIGKYKEKVDLFLDDDSVSRMHARILKDQDQYYLEDENSTNGTFCSKVRLQPYERKRLESGDELRIGNVTLFFR